MDVHVLPLLPLQYTLYFSPDWPDLLKAFADFPFVLFFILIKKKSKFETSFQLCEYRRQFHAAKVIN